MLLLLPEAGYCVAWRPPIARRRSVIVGATSSAFLRDVLASRAFAADAPKADDAEYWPGRLEGTPPPNPRTEIRSSPPFVILPGFGNDQNDYIIPNGYPAEVGFQAALKRRGVQGVSVVPISRPDWLGVARGLSDPKFLSGDAQPEGPAFSWYIDKARQCIEEAVAERRRASAGKSDGRVVLVGHSAGGWLARALLCTAGDAWAREHVCGVVTLGSPHASPPPSVPDQTRGTVVNVNRRAPGAFLASAGIFYVTVTSTRVVGDESGDAAARNGFTAYRLLLGRGQGVVGDGFVPAEAATLDGATKQLSLRCFHSGGAADPWPQDDWYGAERNVDDWLTAVADCIAVQCKSESQEGGAHAHVSV
jgi:pimeloyl-ACP methyl ester carboxylesterase